LAPLGDWGGVLTWLALGGLAMGGVASALAGLRGLAGVASSAPVAARGCYRIAPLVLGVGLLASFVPVGSWTLLLLALGVAASALAPAAVLTGWSERARPGGIAAGAAVGLLTFALVALVGIASSGGPGSDWGSAIAAGPATLAVPAHLLVAWLLRARRPPAHRPPAGLDDMAAAAPPSAG
jgi:hypothetical protein